MGNWKRWTLPPLALLLLLLCAGCASSKTEEIVEIGVEEMRAAREGPGGAEGMGRGPRGEIPADREGRPQAATASSGWEQGGADGFAMPSDGRMQGARQASYEQIGEVEKIVGNEVTLLLQKQSGGTYEPTGERVVYLIPVGMQLSSGDYSSLSAGMLLGLSAEGDMIRDAVLLRG